MLLPHLTKVLPLLYFAVIVTALSAPPSALDNAVALSCQSEFALCLRQHQDVNVCRDSVCSFYGDECTPCQASDASDFIGRSVQAVSKRSPPKPPRNHCIVICTHARCDLLCTNPAHPSSASADDADTTRLLAAANAQPNQLGLPLTPGMSTVILGQKQDADLTKTCAWICSGKTSCMQICWAAGDVQGALVTDGGPLADGKAVEGLGDCEVMDKSDVGRLMVCIVPEVAGGDMVGAGDMDFNVCHKV